MINSIRMENFKAFSKASVDFGKVTILTGENGAGKTSVIQALMLLKQLGNSNTLNWNGSFVNLDSWDECVRLPNARLKIGFSALEAAGLTMLNKASVVLDAEFTRPGVLDEITVSMSDEKIKLEGSYNRLGRAEESKVPWKGSFILVRTGPNIVTPFSVTGFTGSIANEVMNEGQQVVQHLSAGSGRILEEIELVPVNRGFNRSLYPLGDTPTTHFQNTADTSSYESMMATTLEYKRDEIEGTLSQWLKEITGISVRAPLGQGKNIRIVAKKPEKTDAKPVNIAFEGFGSNQLVFVLLPLALAGKGSTIIIEEPEMHLHPLAQARLVRVLLSVCKERNAQLVVTTHSEHIMATITTAVAEKMYAPEEVQFNYLSSDGDSSSSSRILIDERGMVKGGMPGFFEASIEEAERHLRAIDKGK